VKAVVGQRYRLAGVAAKRPPGRLGWRFNFRFRDRPLFGVALLARLSVGAEMRKPPKLSAA